MNAKKLLLEKRIVKKNHSGIRFNREIGEAWLNYVDLIEPLL